MMPAEKNAVRISAANGVGLNSLLRLIAENLPDPVSTVTLRLPYKETALAAWLHENAGVQSEDYREDGIYITATVKRSRLSRVMPFLWKN